MLRGASRRRKDTIAKNLSTTLLGERRSYRVDLDDTFVKQSSSLGAQLLKSSGTPLEVVDNIKTALSPHELLVVEILSAYVLVAVVVKKATFLDIKYLQRYSYEALHRAHERITGEKIAYEEQNYHSVETIIDIVSYEVIYKLPRKIVLIEGTATQFYKISRNSGDIQDEAYQGFVTPKAFKALSGYAEEEVYRTISKRRIKHEKNSHSQKDVFLISVAQKAYVDRIEHYFDTAEYRLKKLHSLQSALYSSFYLNEKEAVMRVHVSGTTAYCMEKYASAGFEYSEYDLSYNYEGLELATYGMDEVIVSGEGEAYEQLKQNFKLAQVNVRTFQYSKDLPKCIIRLEKGLLLDNSFSLLIGVAYHELFRVNFATVRLGVSQHATGYELLQDNLHLLPFVMVFLVAAGAYGTHLFVEHRYTQVHDENRDISLLMKKKEQLKEAVAQKDVAIQKVESRAKRLEAMLKSRLESEDALILHEIAQKLPDDIILTQLSKRAKRGKRAKGSIIHITGKCFHEKSLLTYIKALEFKTKKVFLTSLKDSKKFESESVNHKGTASVYAKFLENFVPKEGVAKQSKEMQEMLRQMEIMASQKQEVYFSDTLNNTFVLEIK